MGMIPHKDFTSAAAVLANAAEVRKRLLNPKKFSSTDADALRARNKALSSEIEMHKQTIQKLVDKIERMNMDIADLNGALLCQAHMIIDTFRSSSGEEERIARRSPRQIIESVLVRDYPNVTFTDIIGPRRHRSLAEPRHKCMVAVYTERPDLSLPQIGRVFDRDHTTILHAINKHDAKRVTE